MELIYLKKGVTIDLSNSRFYLFAIEKPFVVDNDIIKCINDYPSTTPKLDLTMPIYVYVDQIELISEQRIFQQVLAFQSR